jgi:hypothetical protein
MAIPARALVGSVAAVLLVSMTTSFLFVPLWAGGCESVTPLHDF